jgi:hypothetical protein
MAWGMIVEYVTRVGLGMDNVGDGNALPAALTAGFERH